MSLKLKAIPEIPLSLDPASIKLPESPIRELT
jgi:hypothetical protein